MRTESITDMNFPSMCDLENCAVKSYSSIRTRITFIMIRYFIGSISSLNIVI